MATTLAWLRLRAGAWEEAEQITQDEIEGSVSVVQLVGRTILAELAVRRGDADASERLADLAAQAVRAHEPQRIVPVLELEIEWALTRETPMPLERIASLLAEVRRSGDQPVGEPSGRRPGRPWPESPSRSIRRPRRRTPPWCGAIGAAQPTPSARSVGATTER
jgi:hypothetical protein